MSTTLVFPATTPEAFAYIDEAKQRGESVLAAASVEVQEVRHRYGHLNRLPFIHDAAFSHAFLNLIKEGEVERIVAPVASVHKFVSQWLNEHGMSNVRLLGESPITRQVRAVEDWMNQAQRLHPFVLACSQGNSETSSPIVIAALLKQAMGIYGESDLDKLAAMIGVFARAVPGDVVEIGALMGRTAFLLLALARRHRIGSVLVVDPWSAQNARQVDSPLALQQVDGDWDHERLTQGFLLNWLPYAGPDMNYLRLPSHEGYEIYQREGKVFSNEFGDTSYRRSIAVLHIDGNHDLAAVQRDCDLWLSHMAPGGWLILDDYVWAHGCGPQLVGDQLLTQWPDISHAFVAGKALFLRRASA
jgi:hypothetical protein